MKFFDPRSILALILISVSAYSLGVFNTSREYKARDKADTNAAQSALDGANERVRELERAGGLLVDSRVQALKKELDDAKTDHKIYIAGVRSGAIRVSIPIATRPAGPSADSASAGGSGNETRAELDAEAAATLDAIAGDGDDAIRTLNSCIDIYNGIREKYNVQAR